MHNQQRIVTSDGVLVPYIQLRPEDVAESESVAIFAHGITSEKTEEGLFTQAAHALNQLGYETVQFDFRGHGDSAMPLVGMMIAGEVRDLTAVIQAYCERKKVVLIASSFGTVSASLLKPEIKNRIAALLLLNPVLDVLKTFFEPELPWQLRNFGRRRIEDGVRSGTLVIEDRFELGSAFLRELAHCDPRPGIREYANRPILIIHGDQDTFVSHYISEQFAATLGPSCKFVSVPGSEHGFHSEPATKLVVNEIAAVCRDFLLASQDLLPR